MNKIVFLLVLLSLILILLYYYNYLDFFYIIFKYPLKLISAILPRNNSLELQQELIYAKSQIYNLQQENQILRDQLNLEPSQDFKLILAHVIGSGASFLIDKNIPDKPVIINNILIGKTLDNGKVRLITSQDSHVQALIQESNIRGIVSGEYDLNLIMNLPLEEVNIKKGQIVITSESQGFPNGLVIGQILDITKNDNQTSQYARIQPLFNPKDLEKVFIIVSLGGGDDN